MKKGTRTQGIVDRIEFPNKGIVFTEDGEKVIVKNTIPGQKVEFIVNKVRRGKAEGRLMEVVEKSPLEEKCDCPHFGICGGCVYKSLPYEKQLELKENQVKKLIEDAVKDNGIFINLVIMDYWDGEECSKIIIGDDFDSWDFLLKSRVNEKFAEEYSWKRFESVFNI